MLALQRRGVFFVMYAEHLTENSDIGRTIDFAIEKGFSILPVKSKIPDVTLLPKDEQGKPTWKPLQNRMPTIKELRVWEQAEGIALITGKINGIIVLDVDVKGDKTGIDSLKGKYLPITPTVKTPSGGMHYYYQYPQGIEKVASKTNLLEKVDIKADGGYVVMPFTNGYEWFCELSIDDVPLADPPKWLLELIQPQKTEKKPRKQRVKPITSVTPTVSPITVDKDYLKAWDTNEQYVKKACEILGIPDVPIGKAFKCVIPNHSDEKPSASLYREPNGTIVYRDWHGGRQFYTLAEIRAMQAYGKEIELRAPEIATWKLRLLVETGCLQPVTVQAPELPDILEKKRTVKQVYKGFKFLLGCKWIYTPNVPTAFSYRFATAWCGVSDKTVRAAMKQLEAWGLIKREGKAGKGAMEVTLYNAGDKK